MELPAVTTHDQVSQAFSLCISILQTIKHMYGRWELSGNETQCWLGLEPTLYCRRAQPCSYLRICLIGWHVCLTVYILTSSPL